MKNIKALVNLKSNGYRLLDYLVKNPSERNYVLKIERNQNLYGIGIILKKLVNAGLISVEKGKRKHTLYITSRGREIYNDLNEIMKKL